MRESMWPLSYLLDILRVFLGSAQQGGWVEQRKQQQARGRGRLFCSSGILWSAVENSGGKWETGGGSLKHVHARAEVIKYEQLVANECKRGRELELAVSSALRAPSTQQRASICAEHTHAVGT